MTDGYDGGVSVSIENNNIQELQVISGTFNAEYGRAMSGIINMVTKDGSNNFKSKFKTYTGDHYTGDQLFKNLNQFNILNQKNVEYQISGPIIPNYVHFSLHLDITIQMVGYLA